MFPDTLTSSSMLPKAPPYPIVVISTFQAQDQSVIGHRVVRRGGNINHFANSCACHPVLPVLGKSRLFAHLFNNRFRSVVFIWVLSPLDRPCFSVSVDGHVVDIHWAGIIYGFPFVHFLSFGQTKQLRPLPLSMAGRSYQEVGATMSDCGRQTRSSERDWAIWAALLCTMLFPRLRGPTLPWKNANSVSSTDEEYPILHSRVQNGNVRFTLVCEDGLHIVSQCWPVGSEEMPLAGIFSIRNPPRQFPGQSLRHIWDETSVSSRPWRWTPPGVEVSCTATFLPLGLQFFLGFVFLRYLLYASTSTAWGMARRVDAWRC